MILAAALTLLAKPIVIYVSPSGNDNWTGEYVQRRGSKGPLRTLEAARLRVRKLEDGKRPVDVLILPSSKEEILDKPFVLTPEDSGTVQAPVTYRSVGAPATFSGMQRLAMKRGSDGCWRAALSQVTAVSEVFVDGRRRLPARLPLKGYFTIEAAVPPSPRAEGKGHDRFQYRPGDVRSTWLDDDSAEFVMFHNWIASRLRPGQIDPTSRTVMFKSPTCNPSDWAALRSGDRYLVENVPEGLVPGTWCFDRRERELTYQPLPGEDPTKTKVEIPRLPYCVEFRGEPSKRRFVEHVQVMGLNFRGSRWALDGDGRSFPQAEADLSGAIRLSGTRHCLFAATNVYQCGEYAFDVGESCQDIWIKNSNFEDLGAGGVKIGLMPLVKDPALVTGNVTVDGCTIVGGGRVHPAGIGVWIGSSAHNTVRNNWIEDFTYTGVSVGWSWGYGESGAHHNLIEGNTIKDIGQGVLSDMGGVYLLGVAPGTVVRGNRISNVRSYSYGGWGLYTDEGSTGVLLENNVVFGTKSAGFHQHYGKENVVRNNVFAFGDEHQLMRTRKEDHLSFTFEHNIVLFKRGELLGSNWEQPGFDMRSNLYWREDGASFDFAGKDFAAWQRTGQDQGSLISDPLFADPERGDFRLKAGSPAGRVGFVPVAALAPTKAPWKRYSKLERRWP
ncbi:MAG: right-handed parallel beta-helix repeat-containing protein [Armatimonadetes bacterium]|nr:right-handed parallel beta-helix repeat-containing protein [Armatimonadota bacterium]